MSLRDRHLAALKPVTINGENVQTPGDAAARRAYLNSSVRYIQANQRAVGPGCGGAMHSYRLKSVIFVTIFRPHRARFDVALEPWTLNLEHRTLNPPARFFRASIQSSRFEVRGSRFSVRFDLVPAAPGWAHRALPR